VEQFRAVAGNKFLSGYAVFAADVVVDVNPASLYFEADRLAAQQGRGDQGRACSRERVEHKVLPLCEESDQLSEQVRAFIFGVFSSQVVTEEFRELLGKDGAGELEPFAA